MKFMLEIVENYLLLKKQINPLIKRSGYRNEFIARKIGMQPDYFAVKKQRGNWSDNEVLKIIKVIDSEDISNHFDKIIIENCFPGNTASSEEFEKLMGWS